MSIFHVMSNMVHVFMVQVIIRGQNDKFRKLKGLGQVHGLLYVVRHYLHIKWQIFTIYICKTKVYFVSAAVLHKRFKWSSKIMPLLNNLLVKKRRDILSFFLEIQVGFLIQKAIWAFITTPSNTAQCKQHLKTVFVSKWHK